MNFKKLGFAVLAPIALFVLAACESNIPGLTEIEDDLRAQLNVASVECATPNDTLSVGVRVQCYAYSPTGAEISFEGIPFTVTGWSVVPDSLATVSIEGVVWGLAPGNITVTAGGTDLTSASKDLVIIP